ncbi:hypothetical protein YTPLAS18_13080 [Nitrospira sp.]|nr:hypothetical protein YTPLAS18_13080 [Nitrospira sp.]
MSSTFMMTDKELRYCVHGVDVRIVTDSHLFIEPATTLLRYFRWDASPSAREVSLHLMGHEHRNQIPIRVPVDAEPLCNKSGTAVGDALRQNWACTISRAGRTLFADFHEQGLVVIDSEKGEAHAFLVRPEAMHADILDSYVHFMLTELLRYHGLFTMHATSLEKHGLGVLIPGFSGRGKTTTFLSLLRSGYRYLSDDHPMLRDAGGEIELLSFPMKVDVTEHTISFFPELREAGVGVLQPGPRKQFFYVEDVYAQAAIGNRCKPALILFPHVVDAERSSLERLPKSQVMQDLLPQGLVAYDRDLAGRQFQVLAKLASQVDCYRLNFGRDVLGLPALIDPLLEAAHT